MSQNHSTELNLNSGKKPRLPEGALHRSRTRKTKEAIQEPKQELKQEDKVQAKRGRKIKYTSDEDRINARRKQQREYRARKKQELETLKQQVQAQQQ